MDHHRATDALPFTIEARALVYAPTTRKVARFDPPRLVAACPMPDCGWFVTAPDSPAGSALACVGRARHALGDHPEAIEAGMLVLADAPYDGDTAVERVVIRHDLTAAECGPTCEEARAIDPAYGLGDPIGRGMVTAGEPPRGSGYSSGTDMSRPDDHGLLHPLP